jgi:hypothetical protein
MDVMPGADDTWEVESPFDRFVDAPEHSWWAGAGDPSTTSPVAPVLGEPTDPDPYAVLRVPKDASWDEIIAAYRRQVRWWHPDGLGDCDGAERDACEDRIRVLNAAYAELRVRRGR